MLITGNLIDIRNREIYPASINIQEGKIESIQKIAKAATDAPYILPGFIDAHVHIESSMLTPTEFARLAVIHGTVATVSDPHEIGNVLGVAGVEFMIENGNKSPFKFFFGAPSCVPATTFETAEAEITTTDVEYLLKKKEIKYLAEMMNWPGVLNQDPDVLEKIALAKKYGKPVDGHAPGLMGAQAINYINAGISTDHECFTYEEAENKLKHGMKIIIREGSAAKNFEALVDLIPTYYKNMMFCSDDKHPDSLVEGHINQLVLRSLAKGIDLFKVLQVACINPVEHYGLDVGQLNVGDDADFILVDSLATFNKIQTFIKGTCIAKNGKSELASIKSNHPNKFSASIKSALQFKQINSAPTIPVIEVVDGELITHKLELAPKIKDGNNVSDVERDLLKIAVVNRYEEDANPAIGFINNFGLKNGALASSVAHDSHNIICVGVDDASITKAVNAIINSKGGICAVNNQELVSINLPIAGLITYQDGYTVSDNYIALDKLVKEMGCTLKAPFMSLSFMALLVIPSIKLSDLGLFDAMNFKFY